MEEGRTHYKEGQTGAKSRNSNVDWSIFMICVFHISVLARRCRMVFNSKTIYYLAAISEVYLPADSTGIEILILLMNKSFRNWSYLTCCAFYTSNLRSTTIIR